jgi:hypothetical protein
VDLDDGRVAVFAAARAAEPALDDVRGLDPLVRVAAEDVRVAIGAA